MTTSEISFFEITEKGKLEPLVKQDREFKDQIIKKFKDKDLKSVLKDIKNNIDK
jgi:hypothetical protein